MIRLIVLKENAAAVCVLEDLRNKVSRILGKSAGMKSTLPARLRG